MELARRKTLVRTGVSAVVEAVGSAAGSPSAVSTTAVDASRPSEASRALSESAHCDVQSIRSKGTAAEGPTSECVAVTADDGETVPNPPRAVGQGESPAFARFSAHSIK